MRVRGNITSPMAARACLWSLLVFLAIPSVRAQTDPSQRTFQQSKATVEKALRAMRSNLAGHLPALEGFAQSGDHPLDRYQRGYYQTTVQVSPGPGGGSVVRVSTKVTAWYADSIQSRSGYQLLSSNGRLESDFLEQLSDVLGGSAGANGSSGANSGETSSTVAVPGAKQPANAGKTAAKRDAGEAIFSAPIPRLPDSEHPFPSLPGTGLSGRELADTKNLSTASDQPASKLQAEAASLEEVLKNQAHPKNLVAIKKSGTPVVATPSLNGKTLFLASAQDEFEMLDFNADWVHVRISGLSRGWIWRTSLEMPEGISDVPTNGASAKPVVADLFQVSREETAPFPGDWEPLRGKSVRIISVQKIQENEKDSGAQAKLEFAKSLLDKNYAELAAKSKEVAGVVLIFDSIDGGMIAATLPTVQQWKAGTLSDAALWHQCYFDPPETFSLSNPAGTQ